VTKFRSFQYFLQEAAVSLVRNRWMTIASMLTVASCIFILAVSFTLATNMDYMLKQFESSIGISVIVKDDTTAEQVTALFNKITAMDNVKSVTYVSAEDAKERFAQELGEDADILEAFPDPSAVFPRSFDIELKDIRQQDQVIQQLTSLSSEGVESVRHGQQAANLLMTVNSAMRVIMIILIAGFSALSVVIIMNTIKITVGARRTEIGIMKYVGATDWFIRWPFMLEGLIIGIVGSLIPALVCMAFYGRVVQFAYEKLPVIGFIKFQDSASLFLILLPLCLIMGALIGGLGSFWSIRRHLKV